MSFLRLALLLIATTLSLAAPAAKKSCEQSLLPVPTEFAVRFLAETLADLKVFGDRSARSHAPFRQWLAENGIDWFALADGSKYDTLGRYFGPLLAPYGEADVAPRRRQQLAKELRHRGADAEDREDGYTLLSRISESNLEKLLHRFRTHHDSANRPARGDAVHAEVSQALENLAFAFVHNTTSLDRRPSLPLLSARELVSMGITEKLNSKPFNSKVLKTDGNVYFFAIPYSKRGPFPMMTSQYGNASVILSEGFAEEWGWMSPYVMYPRELLEMASTLLPDEAAEVQRLSGSPPPLDGSKLEALKLKAWAPVVRALYRFDMRSSHYLQLIRETLRLSLEQLAVQNRTEYQRVIESLNSGRDLLPVIEQYSFKKLGLPTGHGSRSLELKIPVSVPVGMLDFRIDPINDFPMPGRRLPSFPKGPQMHRWDPQL